jgi:tRNA (cytidine/uridine-2'-O-)-methyltransferase
LSPSPEELKAFAKKVPFLSRLCWSQAARFFNCDTLPHPLLSAPRTVEKPNSMRLALYEPDIPQNLGAFIRLAACLGVALDIIEPCGFPVDDRRIRRASMDYVDLARLRRHASWAAFRRDRPAGRLVLLTTAGAAALPQARFEPDDILLVGRESAGVPPEVHEAADLRVRVPMQKGARSLNVALAATMVLSEALRQTDGYQALA